MRRDAPFRAAIRAAARAALPEESRTQSRASPVTVVTGRWRASLTPGRRPRSKLGCVSRQPLFLFLLDCLELSRDVRLERLYFVLLLMPLWIKSLTFRKSCFDLLGLCPLGSVGVACAAAVGARVVCSVACM